MALTGTQFRTGIPPLSYLDYPVDIQVRISEQGTCFRALILSAGHEENITIDLTRHDLARLSHQMRKEMQIASKQYSRPVEPTSQREDDRLAGLAQIGCFAMKKVFGAGMAMEILGASVQAVSEQLGASRPVSIQFTSETFFLPWELFYSGSADEPPSWQHFWGANHVISRVVVQEMRPGSFVSPVIRVRTSPELGLLSFRDLPHVMAEEVPFFDRLASDGRISLVKLRDLDKNKKVWELQEFRRFWKHDFNLAHFACHAHYDNDAPDSSYILVTDRFAVSLQDMETYNITDIGRPLVFMNACESGSQDPLYTPSFARAFLRYGARGVLATECAVPDAFAVQFAKELYPHLLAGEPLGHSLLAMRNYFYRECGDPSGLLYALYGPPSIRLVAAEEKVS